MDVPAYIAPRVATEDDLQLSAMAGDGTSHRVGSALRLSRVLRNFLQSSAFVLQVRIGS